MDGPTRSIVDFVRTMEYSTMSPAHVHAVVRNYVDSVACAAAGFDGEPVVIARRLAATTSGTPAASTYGLAQPSLIEFAVFANGIAHRYADYSDHGLKSGHPSDMASALVAMAEATNATGRDLACALSISYETAATAGAVAHVRDRGWDQGVTISMGAVAGIAKLARLTDEQLAHALAIAMAPSTPLRITRAGELSHWKGAANAHAAFTAMLAVRLAQAGMTGPTRVFDGVSGVFQNVTGPFDLGVIGPKDGQQSAPERTQHKMFPAEGNCQGPIHMMLALREKVHPEDIESLNVATFHMVYEECGGGRGDKAQKWDPQTRETADHSLPYLMATTLVDGQMTLDTFKPARFLDPALRPIMAKITVTDDDEMTARYKATMEQGASIEVKLKDGRVIRDQISHPRGHRANPMTDAEIGDKFDRMVARVLPAAQRDDLRERLWSLPDQKDLRPIFALFRQFELQS